MEPNPVEKQLTKTQTTTKTGKSKITAKSKKAALSMVNEYQKKSTNMFMMSIMFMICIIVSGVYCFTGNDNTEDNGYSKVPGGDEDEFNL